MSNVSLINGHIDGADTCVICGRDIPEGSQVCVICGKTEPRDLVEVIRCKDCKYYKQNPYSPDEDMMCMCWCDWLPTDTDDFCSYGERKETE